MPVACCGSRALKAVGLQVLQEKGELGEQVAAARMERNALLAAQRAGQGQGLPTTPSVANREQPLASDQRLELQWKAAWLTSSCALQGSARTRTSRMLPAIRSSPSRACPPTRHPDRT